MLEAGKKEEGSTIKVEQVGKEAGEKGTFEEKLFFRCYEFCAKMCVAKEPFLCWHSETS